MVSSTQQAAPTREVPRGRFHNAADWWHELGDVPLERIVMNPWPGTAVERDMLDLADRDKRIVELIDGTLVEKPVGAYESLIAAWLIHVLNAFVRPRGLGWVLGETATIRMASGRVRSPDVTFISAAEIPGGQFPTEAVPRVPPTIAVEVLSASNTVWEIRQKLLEYFESGSRLVWVVDPARRTVAVYVRLSTHPERLLTEGDVLEAGDVLPGFTLNVSELFAVSSMPPKI